MKSPALKNKIVTQLVKAKAHLVYSYAKVTKLQLTQDADEEALETLESFSIRFARYSDLIISRYLRLLILEKDPAFKGSVIDLLNSAEKLGWIDSSATWFRIRELRNSAAHEYLLEDYLVIYTELIKLTPHLLKVKLDL